MARVVILSFTDNDAANATVQQLLASAEPTQEGWGDRVAVLGTILASSAKVEAVIARPTAYCKCPGNKRGEYRKTERFGWWVHKCNKPSVFIVRNFIKNLYLGYNNLLSDFEKKDTPKEETNNEQRPNVESLG